MKAKTKTKEKIKKSKDTQIACSCFGGGRPPSKNELNQYMEECKKLAKEDNDANEKWE